MEAASLKGMSPPRAPRPSLLWLLMACLALLPCCGGTEPTPGGTTLPPQRVTDRDRDGVSDDGDICPDPDPDPDTDEDGVGDAEDVCPSEPAWRSDAATSMGGASPGCPLPHLQAYADGPPGDLDNDGYMDDVDRCPNHAETFPSRFDGGCTDDGDGCPDGTPMLTINCEVMILDSLYFAPRRATLTEQAEPILTAIVTLLAVQEWSHVTLQVIGHSDDSEAAGLGQRRADTVIEALVAGGLDAARLSTRDAGSAEPRAAITGLRGRTLASAREQNRRVSFQITHPRRLPGRPEQDLP